jgi:CIC family chloride channel protein
MANALLSAFDRLYRWRIRHLSNRNFLLLSSVVVGLVAAAAAVLLKSVVHLVQHTVQEGINWEHNNFLFFLTPMIGILLTVIVVRQVLKGKLGRGVTSVLFDIHRRNANVAPVKTWSQMLTSAITVGLGGSAGLEAPIVVTGSAIGSNISKLLRLSVRERTVLLAAGAAAGISAVFNTPIAGVLFALEVLLAEFSLSSFIPLLISAATAAVFSKATYSEALFAFEASDYAISEVPWYLLLGGVSALLSVWFLRMTYMTERLMARWKSVFWKAILGGLGLGIIVFLLPPLYGEGYGSIESLIQGDYHKLLRLSLFTGYKDSPLFLLGFAAVIMMVKVFATTITLEAGGNGGIFAPSLFMGAMNGFVVSHSINLSEIAEVREANFIVAGMAGTIAGVLHAPLTAIFLIAEVTGGYTLFVPLMMVAAISFFVTRAFEPYSIYTKKLALRGIIAADKDRNALSRIKVKNVLETNFTPIAPDLEVRDLIKEIANSTRNVFPVVDPTGKLMGVVILDNIREIIFNPEETLGLNVSDLMSPPPATLKMEDDGYDVMNLFDRHNAWNLPVVDDEGKYVGFISKSALLSKYRDMLIRQNKPIE